MMESELTGVKRLYAMLDVPFPGYRDDIQVVLPLLEALVGRLGRLEDKVNEG